MPSYIILTLFLFCLTNGSEAWNENSAKEMTKVVGEELKGKTNE